MKNITENTPKYTWPASFSRINSLMTGCESAWIKSYITRQNKAPVKNQHLFDIGNFVHKVLEECTKRTRKLEDFRNVWDTMETNYRIVRTHPVEVREFYPYTKEMYRRVLEFKEERGATWDAEYLLAVDKNFTPVPYRYRYSSMFLGYIDVLMRINKDVLIILDYKTEKYTGDTSRLETQLDYYSYFLFKLNPQVNKIVGMGAYVRDNVVTVVKKDHRENIEALNNRVEGRLHEYVDRVKNIDITKEGQGCTKDKEQCNWCNFY